MNKNIFKRFLVIAVIATSLLLAGNASAIPNGKSVISPYWQAESGIYTFIVVSHPSLSGMASSIGVKLDALQSSSAVNATNTFTVTAGNSKRLFIVPSTSFGTQFAVNTSNTADGTFLITNTTNSVNGNLRFSTVSQNDTLNLCVPNSQGATNCDLQDITSLSYWGAIVILSTSTGFAMEFVGDMQDSLAFDPVGNFSGVN